MTVEKISGLKRKVLEAALGLYVADILLSGYRPDSGVMVASKAHAVLPEWVRERFYPREIAWREDREVWGISFDLKGDDPIEVGHFRGHHLATWPQAYDYTEAEAWRVLRIEVEGVLLHELGHALVGYGHEVRGEAWLRAVTVRFLAAVQAKGWPTGYAAGAGGGRGDVHEGVAEAFRWWSVAPDQFGQERPDLAWVGPALLQG